MHVLLLFCLKQDSISYIVPQAEPGIGHWQSNVTDLLNEKSFGLL